jgi:hypothetical protein
MFQYGSENHMNEPELEPPFTPVAVRARHDGWTVAKQYAFIEALADTGIVEDRRRSLSGGQASTTMAGPRARVRL